MLRAILQDLTSLDRRSSRCRHHLHQRETTDTVQRFISQVRFWNMSEERMLLWQARERAVARLVEIIDRHAEKDAAFVANYLGADSIEAKHWGSAEIVIRAANAIACIV